MQTITQFTTTRTNYRGIIEMNCKACLHPRWAHNGFQGIGKCQAFIDETECNCEAFTQ